MHSSRMHTSRSLTICRSLLPRGVSASWGVVSAPGGMGVFCSGGVCSHGGVCSGGLLPGVSALRGCLLLGGVCSWGVSAPGGCLLWGLCLLWGGSALGCSLQGGMVSQHALRQTPTPPVNRMTDSCKNITLATTSLRPVITVNNQDTFNNN